MRDSDILETAHKRQWSFPWDEFCLITFVREYNEDYIDNHIDDILDKFENLPNY